MTNFRDKIEHSKKVIEKVAAEYKNIAVSCSFGKDSIATLHLVHQVAPQIPVFYVATIFKPQETLEYAMKMKQKMNLNLTVYLVAKELPDILKRFGQVGVEVVLLPTGDYKEASKKSEENYRKPLYQTDPDLCCQLLKVEPTKVAVKDLDAWLAGLRKTEGFTRQNFQEIEMKGNLVKINPILEWTELDVWRYLALNHIPPNPLYAKGYRSLGCAVCTKIIGDGQKERAGRWQGTSKCEGECGIHTQRLK